MIGSTVDSSVNYAVFVGSVQFTAVTCNATNHCTLKVTGSQLTVDGLFTVSVVAFNAVGNGEQTIFPTPGLCIIFG